MQQYLKLLKTVKDQGTYKPPAREGMPGSTSLFGYQFRHDLSQGFPLLTTKKMYWKGIVVELLWFLRGDTNIKYLIDNGVHIWDQDAYNYYLKKCEQWKKLLSSTCKDHANHPLAFDRFIAVIEGLRKEKLYIGEGYYLGDCGYQYGKVWRGFSSCHEGTGYNGGSEIFEDEIDQIANVIKSLKTNPEGRRHIVTAIDPGHDQDLALYWCHAMFQFNCRPLTFEQRKEYLKNILRGTTPVMDNSTNWEQHFAHNNVPQYYLDCQLYQRSADVVLGVPFNIASYALLTHIIAKICNMVPGEFIHTFGDVHIYDNHQDAVNEQLSRTPTALPTLRLFECSKDGGSLPDHFEKYLTGRYNLDDFIQSMEYHDFQLVGYNPQSKIKAELSTGLKK